MRNCGYGNNNIEFLDCSCKPKCKSGSWSKKCQKCDPNKEVGNCKGNSKDNSCTNLVKV